MEQYLIYAFRDPRGRGAMAGKRGAMTQKPLTNGVAVNSSEAYYGCGLSRIICFSHIIR